MKRILAGMIVAAAMSGAIADLAVTGKAMGIRVKRDMSGNLTVRVVIGK